MKGVKGFQKGHKGFHTEESRKAVAEKTKKRMAKYKGIVPPWLVGKGFKVGHELQLGERHWAWKGDDVGRTALHDWVKHRLGRPSKCEHCGTTTAKKFEWANKSHEYKRDLSDWLRLCVSCHNKYDGHRYKMWETRRAKAVLI